MLITGEEGLSVTFPAQALPWSGFTGIISDPACFCTAGHPGKL